MADSAVEVLETEDLATPWEFQAVPMLPESAWRAGGVVALGMLVLFVAFQLVMGVPFSSPDSALSEETWDSFFVCLLLGYAFAALRVGATGIQRDLVRAGVVSQGVGSFPRSVVRRSRIWGFAGVCAGAVFVTGMARVQGRGVAEPWTEIHESSFLMAGLLLLFWLMSRSAVFTIQGSHFAAQMTLEEIEVDLLDLRPLNAFGRIGHRREKLGFRQVR